MIELRRSSQRGLAEHGWLRSQHSFSFADYLEPNRMGWGNLRVLNEERIAPGTGFGNHAHREVEILNLVLAGELTLHDSTGQVGIVRPGELQRLSAGSGVRHSEFNHAATCHTHFLQIWLCPAREGLVPSYAQRCVDPAGRRGRLQRVAAPLHQAAADGTPLGLNADASLYLGRFDGAEQDCLALDPARKAYVFLAHGALEVNGQALQAGDALAVAQEAGLNFGGGHDAEVLVLDLAA